MLPTLTVLTRPGMPAKWSPPEDEPDLPTDKGIFYLDHNKGRFPSSPFEPAVQAILHLHSQFDFTTSDIITDRWALGRLMDLAYEQEGVTKQKPATKKKHQGIYAREVFSFAVQLVGSTVVFIRQDNIQVKKKIRSFNAFRKGFGQTHLEYDDDVRGSAAHYRVTAYNLGDIRLLVRHAADAYFPEDAESEADKIAVDGAKATTVNGLQIRSAGKSVPLASVIELTTVSLANNQTVRIREKKREAWISQTGHFMIAKWRETTPKGARAPDGFSHRRAVFPKEHMR